MENHKTESIIEERSELMISLVFNAKPVLRMAYFLKPTFKGPNFKLQTLPPSSLPPNFNTVIKSPNVNFNGWQTPSSEWKSWVHHMEKKYEQTWKKAGIFEAIKTSTCVVHKDTNLVVGIAETWCPDTNTFVFSWGEATVSLEDVNVLGGYSVLGDSPVFAYCDESRRVSEVEAKLREARTKIGRLPARKASQNAWMRMFMFSGSDVEHEAFLSFWLERFVLRESRTILRAKVFQVAIRLAKGERLALAPAVLASIYRDLSLLKAAIVANHQLGSNGNDGDDKLEVTLWSPFHLVQLWVWERFEAFRPKPNVIKSGEPRSALWDKAKGVEIRNVRRVLDSAGETFNWRPYTTMRDGSQFFEFYKEDEELDIESNESLLSFSLCLRVSELVGIDCLEQYLPHRVAMQFGMDQDVPDIVSRSGEGPELAWLNYIRPFGDGRLHIPSRLKKPYVTCRYLDWWKYSILRLPEPKDTEDLINNVIRRKRSDTKRSRRHPQVSIGKEVDVDTDAPPGFASKSKVAKIVDDIDNNLENFGDFPPGFTVKFDNSKIKGKITVKEECIDSDVLPGFHPKRENPKIKGIVTVNRELTDANVPQCLITSYENAKINDSVEDIKPNIANFQNVYVSDRPSRATDHASEQAKSLFSVNKNSVATEKPADERMEVSSVISGSVRAMNHTMDIKPRISNDGRAIINESHAKFIAEASALEARITIIEREIAELKATFFGFEKNL